MNVILPIFGLSFLGSIAGLIGGIILLTNKKWGQSLSVHAVPFAAGVLLTVAFLDLLPESIAALSSEVALPFILVVIVAAFLLQQFLVHFHHHDEHKHNEFTKTVPLVLFGDSVHNFLDGVAIAATFLTEPRLGLLVAVSTFLHELPQEIGDFGLLAAAGWQKKRIITFNLITAAATFLGAGVALLFATTLVGVTNYLLAVAAGLFFYIAATDLLPKVGGRSRDIVWHQSLLFLVGVFLMATVTRFF